MIAIQEPVLNFNYGNMPLIGKKEFEIAKNSTSFWMFRKAAKVDLGNLNMSLQNAVKDVQFAPNYGQSYHLLAVASNDIDLFTIKPAK